MNAHLFTACIILLGLINTPELSDGPSDKEATHETACLYENLKKSASRGFMIGHQDDLAYGVTWKYEPGRSDIYDVTGDFPAVYGWDIGHLETGASVNLDSVPFDKMRSFIREGYQRGGVITISWHGNNPVSGLSAWDPQPGIVKSILPGGELNHVFNKQLDRVADFMMSLKGEQGEMIPVLFRPFHEHTGGWFWWGNATTSDEEYKALYRYTVHYLKYTKQVHHVLYVYNTGSEFHSAEEFLMRYPGDDVIDALSFDIYQSGNALTDTTYVSDLDRHLAIVEQLASQKDKIALIGETGYCQIPYDKWWTDRLLQGIGRHKVAYVLFWRNAGYKPNDKYTEYYVPFKGQISEQNFIEFYDHPNTFFQKDISYDGLYR